MAQSILDMFPDAVSQFGLLGCAFAVLLPLYAAVCIYGLGVMAGRRHAAKSVWTKGRHGSNYRAF
jgi:hypothetical protein